MLHIPIGKEGKRYLTYNLGSIVQPAIACDPALLVVDANKAFCELMSCSKETLLTQLFSDISLAIDPLQETCLLHHLFNKSILEYVVEYSFTAKNDRIVATLLNIRGIYNSTGALENLVMTVLHIFPQQRFSQLIVPEISVNPMIHQEELFEAFVKSIGQTLSVDLVMIGQLSKAGDFSNVITLWENGQIYKQLIFANTNSPIKETIKGRAMHIVANLRRICPENEFLKERAYDWYVGMPIYEFRGNCIGYFVILSKEELPDTKIVQSVLEPMVNQVGIELERMRHAQAIRDIERKYKLVFDHITDAIIIFDHEQSSILSYNQSTLTLFGLDSEFFYIKRTIVDLSPKFQPFGQLSKLAYEKTMLSVFERRQTEKLSWRFRRADDSTFDAMVNLIPYNEEADSFNWMLIIQEDARSKLERETAAQLEQLKVTDTKVTARELALQSELDYRNRKLSSNLVRSSQMTKLLYSIKAALQKLGSDVSGKDKMTINQMLKQIDRSIDLDEDWRKFKLHFEEVHPNFFTKLLNRYPSLNPGQLRHCAYIQLGLSSKETAQLLNVAPKSIEMARYRLKKKLELDKGDRLSEFIQSL